jgi:hypothetical protein
VLVAGHRARHVRRRDAVAHRVGDRARGAAQLHELQSAPAEQQRGQVGSSASVARITPKTFVSIVSAQAA